MQHCETWLGFVRENLEVQTASGIKLRTKWVTASAVSLTHLRALGGVEGVEDRLPATKEGTVDARCQLLARGTEPSLSIVVTDLSRSASPSTAVRQTPCQVVAF